MEEKILIKSENINIKLIRNVIYVAGVVCGLIMYIWRTSEWKSYIERGDYTGEAREMSIFKFMFSDYANSATKWAFIVTFLVFVAIGTLFYYAVSKTTLSVSDKRVYGATVFGKRVDLPLDSISAVGTSMLKGIAVATSSGKIKFFGITNRDEIHNVLSKLLIGRQENKAATQTIKQEIPKSEAEELKKYKELLDMGVISQEEFDAKKKRLLGL